MNKEAFSLVMTLGVIVLIFLMSMVSMSLVVDNANLSRSIYAQNVTLNSAETGLHLGSMKVLEDADNGFVNVLSSDAPVEVGELTYPLFGGVSYEMAMRDNDDLDGDPNVDNDSVFILSISGVLPDVGRTELEVLAEYTGTDTEYAQKTGTSKGNSDFSGESEMGSF